jgi:hypothetical protein
VISVPTPLSALLLDPNTLFRIHNSLGKRKIPFTNPYSFFSDVKSCLIDRKKVTVGELLKEGNFGAVYKGILNNHGREQRIAIKSLKCVTDSSSFESFMREGVLMKGNYFTFLKS